MKISKREREKVKDVDEVAQQKFCKIYCKASIIRYNIVQIRRLKIYCAFSIYGCVKSINLITTFFFFLIQNRNFTLT